MSELSGKARSLYEGGIYWDAPVVAHFVPRLCDEVEALEARVRELESTLEGHDEGEHLAVTALQQRVEELEAVAEAALAHQNARRTVGCYRLMHKEVPHELKLQMAKTAIQTDQALRAAGYLGKPKEENENAPHSCIWRNEPPVNPA